MRIKRLVIVAMLSLCAMVAAPSVASAHCSLTSTGYRTVRAESGSWVIGYQYGTSNQSYSSSGAQLYLAPYSSTWGYAYGRTWVNKNGAWSQVTGWNWLYLPSVLC